MNAMELYDRMCDAFSGSSGTCVVAVGITDRCGAHPDTNVGGAEVRDCASSAGAHMTWVTCVLALHGGCAGLAQGPRKGGGRP